MEITSAIFSKEILASPLFHWIAMSSSFFFIRWRKEKERIKVEELVNGLSPCGSLVGAMH